MAEQSTENRSYRIQVKRDHALGRVLLLLAREVSRQALERMDVAGYGDITLSHFMIMAHIPTDGRRASEIAERAGVTKQAVSKTIDDLKQKGYLASKADPNDARAQIVSFTDRGMDMFEAGVAAADAVEAEMAALLPEGRYADIKAGLIELRQKIGA